MAVGVSPGELRELSDDEIGRIAGTYHAWRGDPDAPEDGFLPAPPDEAMPSNALMMPFRAASTVSRV